MATIEELKNKDEFLAMLFQETETAANEIKDRPPLEHSITNIDARVNLTIFRSEIVMHRQTLRLLIDAYERIAALEQEVNKNGENV